MTLVPEFTFGSLVLTDAPFSVEFGADLGNPEDVVTVLNSLLADGEIELTERTGNRTLQIPLMIDDSDLLALAEAERLLALECAKPRNTLTVDPGDGIAPPTVFETFRGQVIFKRDDDEEQSNVRRFVMTVRALPHGRSVDKIVDNAGTPPSSGGTVLLNCESTTGWARIGGGLTPEYVVDTSIYSQGAGSLRSRATFYQTNYYNYSDGMNVISSSHDGVSGLSLSTGTGGYLSLSLRFEWVQMNLNIYVTTSTGGRVKVASPVATQTDAAGFVHYVWPVDAGLTITGFDVEWGQRGPTVSGNMGHFWFDDFELLPASTSDHQIVKQLDVQGSARTTGSLHIASPTDSVALGQVLAITAPTNELPAGFQPDGRRWVAQGTTTPDSTVLWGSYFTPDTATYSGDTGKPIFDVPVGMLTPGPYMILALANSTTTTMNFGVQAQLRIGSTNSGPLSTAEVTQPTTANVWQFVTVGTAYLPPLPMQSAGTTAKVRLLFKGARFSDVYMIPAWQVEGRAVADYSIVDCGSSTPSAGGSSSNLWLDSPSADQPQGGWWRGPTSDRQNTQSAWPDAKKPGIHTFNPGPLSAFLVSTGAQGPTLALEYFPCWRTNAAL